MSFQHSTLTLMPHWTKVTEGIAGNVRDKKLQGLCSNQKLEEYFASLIKERPRDFSFIVLYTLQQS